MQRFAMFCHPFLQSAPLLASWSSGISLGIFFTTRMTEWGVLFCVSELVNYAVFGPQTPGVVLLLVEAPWWERQSSKFDQVFRRLTAPATPPSDQVGFLKCCGLVQGICFQNDVAFREIWGLAKYCNSHRFNGKRELVTLHCRTGGVLNRVRR